MAIPVDLSTVGGVEVSEFDVGPLDDLYYRFVSEGSSAPTTAVLSMHSKRHINEPPLATALTIDGTAQTIEIDGYRWISFATTTSEAAKLGTLYIFARKTQE